MLPLMAFKLDITSLPIYRIYIIINIISIISICFYAIMVGEYRQVKIAYSSYFINRIQRND